jgi:threonyl-tRNA synthetase
VDVSNATFSKKVHTTQVTQYNFQLVMGKAELTNGTVNIRTHPNKVQGQNENHEMIFFFETAGSEY